MASTTPTPSGCPTRAASSGSITLKSCRATCRSWTPRRSRWRVRIASRSWSFRSSRAADSRTSCAGRGALRSSRTRNDLNQTVTTGNENGRRGNGTMAAEDLIKDLQRRMDGAIEVLRKEFGGLRTGRASASLLEPVMVPAYGGTVPLNQVASVNVPEPRIITVQVWDRGVVKAVDKAIREAGLGLNPQTEGQVIRVPIPDLNEERRRELTRVAAKYAEAARVSVRNVRRDGLDPLKKKEKDGVI